MNKMSEDEKKAIEIVQGLKIYYDNNCLLDEEEIEENETVNNAIDTLINLIEKQQNELEQEKEKNKKLENADLTTVYMDGFYNGEIKWKNKIKEKLEYIENSALETSDEDLNYKCRIEDRAQKQVLKEILRGG